MKKHIFAFAMTSLLVAGCGKDNNGGGEAAPEKNLSTLNANRIMNQKKLSPEEAKKLISEKAAAQIEKVEAGDQYVSTYKNFTYVSDDKHCLYDTTETTTVLEKNGDFATVTIEEVATNIRTIQGSCSSVPLESPEPKTIDLRKEVFTDDFDSEYYGIQNAISGTLDGEEVLYLEVKVTKQEELWAFFKGGKAILKLNEKILASDMMTEFDMTIRGSEVRGTSSASFKGKVKLEDVIPAEEVPAAIDVQPADTSATGPMPVVGEENPEAPETFENLIP